MASLKIGDLAPDFTLMSAAGEAVSLRDYRGRSDVILFFYPKANTPFCTAEACSFSAYAADESFSSSETVCVS